MSIADKLTLLAASKEIVRLKLGIGEDVPFSEYGDYVGWDGITSDLGQSTTTAASQKLVTDEVDKTKDREVLLQDSIASLLKYTKGLEDKLYQITPYTPYHLFRDNKGIGVWLDPSDLTTLYQDSFGTIPVTKDGDPVGLILDKSQGLESSDPVYIQKETNFSFQITSNTSNHVDISKPMPQGFYKITLNFVSLSASNIRIRRGNTDVSVLFRDSSPSALSYEFNGYFQGGEQLNYQDLNRNTEAVLGSIKIENILGNHATQPLAASRPTYRTDGKLHWLEFDGIDDFLVAPKMGDFTTKIVSQYVAANVENVYSCITAQTDSSAQRRLLISYSNTPTISTALYYSEVSPATWVTKSTRDPNFGLKANIINSIMDMPNLEIEGRLNNILMEGTVIPYSATTRGSYYIGNRGDGNSMAKMALYGLIRTDTDIKPLDNTLFKTNDYLANKSGVEI